MPRISAIALGSVYEPRLAAVPAQSNSELQQALTAMGFADVGSAAPSFEYSNFVGSVTASAGSRTSEIRVVKSSPKTTDGSTQSSKTAVALIGALDSSGNGLDTNLTTPTDAIALLSLGGTPVSHATYPSGDNSPATGRNGGKAGDAGKASVSNSPFGQALPGMQGAKGATGGAGAQALKAAAAGIAAAKGVGAARAVSRASN